MNLKDAIIEFCNISEIDEVGFATAKPFYDVEMILINHRNKGLPSHPFVETNIAKRVYPELTLKGAKSFIVITMSYTPKIYKKTDELIGNISPAAVGEDYHKLVMDKLTDITNFITDIYPKANILKFVDNSPFSEKHVAKRAGLGYIAKNSLFYSKKFGSRCFIGLLLTDINLGEDKPIIEQSKCKNCDKCVKACPTSALMPESGFDFTKCISYLTQTKEVISDDLASKMGNQIYGCDICQSVCPNNTKIPEEHVTGIPISLEYLLKMTNREFEEKFKYTAAGWRGSKQLKKNAVIALNNFGGAEAFEVLKLWEN